MAIPINKNTPLQSFSNIHEFFNIATFLSSHSQHGFAERAQGRRTGRARGSNAEPGPCRGRRRRVGAGAACSRSQPGFCSRQDVRAIPARRLRNDAAELRCVASHARHGEPQASTCHHEARHEPGPLTRAHARACGVHGGHAPLRRQRRAQPLPRHQHRPPERSGHGSSCSDS